jgi:hypothetical protein
MQCPSPVLTHCGMEIEVSDNAVHPTNTNRVAATTMPTADAVAALRFLLRVPSDL